MTYNYHTTRAQSAKPQFRDFDLDWVVTEAARLTVKYLHVPEGMIREIKRTSRGGKQGASPVPVS